MLPLCVFILFSLICHAKDRIKRMQYDANTVQKDHAIVKCG